MKKFLKRTILCTLTLLCALLSACSFSFSIPDFEFFSCANKTPVRPTPTPVVTVEDFEVLFIQDEENFTVPTLKGYITRDVFPDKVIVITNDKDECVIEPSTLSFEDNAYKIGFDTGFTFTHHPRKGETMTFKLCIYVDGEKIILPTTATLDIDADYEWMNWAGGIKLDNMNNWSDWI